jgi:hypothetical protein
MFGKLRTLGLPSALQLEVRVTRRAYIPNRSRRGKPFFVRLPNGKRKWGRWVTEHTWKRKRVVNAGRGFRIVSHLGVLRVFRRAHRCTKTRFVNWVANLFVAQLYRAALSTKSRVLWREVVRLSGRLRSKGTTATSRWRWEALPLLEAGGVALHAAVKRGPLANVWRSLGFWWSEDVIPCLEALVRLLWFPLAAGFSLLFFTSGLWVIWKLIGL